MHNWALTGMQGIGLQNSGVGPVATIVVCEDDAEIRDLLSALLVAQGYAVCAVADGRELDDALGRQSADLVVLDWMLPGEDGLAICRRLSVEGGPPVLMLTARDSDADQVAGLETGADAYLAKPFNPRVLLAQVRAALRRAGPPRPQRALRFGELLIEPQSRQVTREGCELFFTGSEFDLLLCFAQRPQRVLSRDELMEITRGRAPGVLDRTIDVQVSRLRQKLEAASSNFVGCIRAVRNAGYILTLPVEQV